MVARRQRSSLSARRHVGGPKIVRHVRAHETRHERAIAKLPRWARRAGVGARCSIVWP